MQHISKKLVSDFNLFSLNDPEITRFYIANIDFLISNFPYFNDLSLVSSFFCSENRKFNQKFYTRITKFIEIIQYDSSSKDKNNKKEENIRANSTNKQQESFKNPNKQHGSYINSINQNFSVDIKKKSLPSYFEQFLKETDSKPFTLDSDSDGEIESFRKNRRGKVPSQSRHISSKNMQSTMPESVSSESTSNYNSETTTNYNSETTSNSNTSPSLFGLSEVLEKLKIKDKKSNSLIEIKNDPRFPNHFPEGVDFTVNSTQQVMKFYTTVLNFHIGKFIVTPFFINQLIKKAEFEEVSDLLCKLVKQGGTLAILAKSANLKEIFFKNLGALEMILESSAGCEIEEEMLVDQVFVQRKSLIYRFFEDAIVQGYAEAKDFDVNVRKNSREESSSLIIPDEINKITNKSAINVTHAIIDEANAANSPTTDYDTTTNDIGNVATTDDHINDLTKSATTTDYNNDLDNVATTGNLINTADANDQFDLSKLSDNLFVKSLTPRPIIFHTAYNILQSVCTQKSGIDIPEIQFSTINRFSLLYYRLLSHNESCSLEMLENCQQLFFKHSHCTHLLISISKIFLKTNPDLLIKIGFFEKLRSSIFSYGHSYNINGIEDSLFAFLLKIYGKFKDFLKNEYFEKSKGNESLKFIKDSWDGAHLIFEYFIKLEKYGFKVEDEENILEYEGFSRFIVDCMTSEIPFSTVFTKY